MNFTELIQNYRLDVNSTQLTLGEYFLNLAQESGAARVESVEAILYTFDGLKLSWMMIVSIFLFSMSVGFTM